MNSISKVALVTGAGSGIGKAFSIALLESGWKVGLVGRTVQKIKETADHSTITRENSLVMPADISDPEQVETVFSVLKNQFARIDLLFNNAGINVRGSIEEITYRQWCSVIDVNLTGTFLCTKEAFKIMQDQKPQGGRIINNGSVSSQVPRPNSMPYSASKHGVTGLTRCTSLDGRKYNIACSQIDIGNAETEMASRMKFGVPQADGTIAVEPIFKLQHVIDALMYMANLPPDVNVPFMTVMATKMPFMGRG